MGTGHPLHELSMPHALHRDFHHCAQGRERMRQGCDAIVGCHLCKVAVDLFPRQAHGTDVAADGQAVLGSMHRLL